MKKLFVTILVLVVIGVGFYYGYQQSKTSPVEVNSKDALTITKDLVDLLAKENYASVENFLDNSAKKAMPKEKIQNTWQSLLTQNGAYKKLNIWGQRKENGNDVVYGMLEFTNDNMNAKVTFNNKKLISDLLLTPSEIKNIRIIPGNASDTTPDGIELANRAKDFLGLLAKEDYSTAEKQCDPFFLNAFLPPDKLKGLWNPLIQKVGSLQQLGNTRTEIVQIDKQNPKTYQTSVDQSNVIYVTCTFEKDTVEIKVSSNDKKQINGLEIPLLKESI